MARWNKWIGLTARRAAIGALVFFAALAAMGSPASAQSCQGQFNNINFGNVDPTSGLPVDVAGTFSVQCQGLPNRTARVCPNLASGTGGDAGSGAARTLKQGQNNLLFSFFTDAARTQVWGSYLWAYAAQSPSPQFDIALGSSGQATQSFPIYGRVYANQTNVAAASYSSNFTGQNVTIASAYSTVGNCATISGFGGQHPGFSVNAVVISTCNMTTTPLSFGVKALLTTITDGSGQLRVTCTTGATYTVGLSGGLSGATSPTTRKMVNNTNSIVYGLYGDAARTQGWFNTRAFYEANGTGSGIAQTLTVYGRMPAQPTPPVGVYSDTVVATITY